MSRIRPAQVTLNALRDGQVMNELAQAIHDATAAVQEHNKPAVVTLTLTLKPLTKGMKEPVVSAVAEVETKLPKQELPTTLFFIDADGNPSRNQERQTELPGVSVVTNQGASNAT